MRAIKSRKGFTLIETALVIAIISLIAIPIGSLTYHFFEYNTADTVKLKQLNALNIIMADMEEHLRSAVSTPAAIDISTSNKITFYSQDANKNIASLPTITQYTYELRADGYFYKNNTIFPVGLEKNIITGLSFPTGADKQQLSPVTGLCFITVQISASNTALNITTTVTKTIYLQDY